MARGPSRRTQDLNPQPLLLFSLSLDGHCQIRFYSTRLGCVVKDGDGERRSKCR